MKDLTIALENRPGALAEMGDALGAAGISIEGGGAFVVDGRGVAHFLFKDGSAARQALEEKKIQVLEERDVVVQRLRQGQPGQLGKLTSRMASAGVNIDVLYSDHDHQLILVVDDVEKASKVAEAWDSSERAEPRKELKTLKRHEYTLQVEWTGNSGEGTRTYRSYKRDYSIDAQGKPSIQGSSDPAFLGDPSRYNPEELLVASLSSCHMLWYLHLCAVNGIVVLKYVDAALGVMEEGAGGSGEFTGVTLNPTVTVAAGSDRAKATALHEEAHAQCFIAKSVKFPVKIVSSCHIEHR